MSEQIYVMHNGISTHTLRGERDQRSFIVIAQNIHFNSHAPWGA